MDSADGTGPVSFQWLFKGWRGLALGLFAALVWLIALSLAFDQTRLAGVLPIPGRGQLGLVAEPQPGQPGRERIVRVLPGSAGAAAGLAPGMVFQFDHRFEAHADYAAGRMIELTVLSDATRPTSKPRHVVLQTRRASAGSVNQLLGYTIIFAGWLSVALGGLAIVRGWGTLGALAFGLGILSYIVTPEPPAWATAPWLAAGFVWLSAVLRIWVVGLLILPAAVYAERIGRPRKHWIVAFLALVGIAAALEVFVAWCAFADASYPVVADGQPPFYAFVILLLLVGLYWAWRGWHEATGADRRRFMALFATLLCMVVIGLLELAIDLTGLWQTSVLNDLVPMVLSNIIVPLLLAYSVLRHRVIDFDFAINRTVVYATFSAILLGSFGLIEWGVEHLLPEDWVKASAWIDAGAAVMVYLAFHRVHDAIERRVEHLFFHHWQANENALRRFVGSAAHFEDTRALARGFADELARFGGDARVAVYRRHEGVLDRVAGTWESAPRHFREDDPAFALMRAERKPLDLGETPTDLPGVLALPMLDHGVLAGLVLLDLKGNGALYRPDEVALLGWAAHEVGLALAALHAGLIETENRLLKSQLARLSGIIGDRMDRATV